MFASERARLHQIVDEQIERSDSECEPIPQVAGDLASISASGVIANDSRATAHDPEVDLVSPVAPKRRSKSLFLIGGGVVLTVVAVFALQTSKQPDVTAAAASSVPVSTPSMDGQAVATSATGGTDPLRAVNENALQSVLLEIKVEPASASVTLDGAPLAAPFHGRFQKTGSFHIIEAHADGYRPFKRLVPFNVDQKIAIKLEDAPTLQAARRVSRTAANERTRADVTPAPESPAQIVPPQKEKEPEMEPGKKMTPGSGSSMRRRLMVDDPYATQQ